MAAETVTQTATESVESRIDSANTNGLLDQAIENTSFQKTYRRLTDDPLDSAKRIGDWIHGAGIVATPSAGAIMALAAISRGIDIIQFASEHQVVMGKITRDYDLLLADLRAAGEDFEWLTHEDDWEKASLKWTWRGREYQYTFTTEMAMRAKLIKEEKPESNWMTYRPNMLRSKTVRMGFKMHCPDLIRGFTTPEDAADIGERPQEAKHRWHPPPPKAERESVAANDVAGAGAADVDPGSSPPPATSPAEPLASNETLTRLAELGCQFVKDNGEQFTVADIAEGVRSQHGCSPAELTEPKAVELCNRFEAMLAEKKQSAAQGNSPAS